MNQVDYRYNYLKTGLLAGGLCMAMGIPAAMAQSVSPQTSENITVSMAPVHTGGDIGVAVPAGVHAETGYPSVGGDVYSQAVEQLFASGQSIPEEIAHAYRMNGMAPLWGTETGVNADVAFIAETFAAAGVHGLDPMHYMVPVQNDATQPGTPFQIAENDLALGRVVYKYLSDIRLGVLRPGILNRDTELAPKSIDMQKLFGLVVADPANGLAAAPPPTLAYQNLVQLLAIARTELANGEWGTVSGKRRSLRPGKKDKRVPQIEARLTLDGSYIPPIAEDMDPLVYAPHLVEAVKTFQARHGLGVDGIAGRQTIAAMNVTAAERVEQVIANLERERWQPEQAPDRLVEVNVPAFHLVARDGGVPVLDMDVIVGRSKRPTPIFSDSIRFVEFNPTWNVPKKLAVEDIGPHALEDPEYLSRKGFTIFSSWKPGAVVIDPTTIDWSAYTKYNFPFHIQQAPGTRNSLGSVKFLFPNKFAVYLHDTPSKNLFRKAVRTFSSGCVRVSNPRAFTSYLLASQYGESQIDKAFSRKKTRRVKLNNPVTVRLVYRTAWLSKNGEPQYRADIYKRDRRVIRELRARGLGL